MKRIPPIPPGFRLLDPSEPRTNSCLFTNPEDPETVWFSVIPEAEEDQEQRSGFLYIAPEISEPSVTWRNDARRDDDVNGGYWHCIIMDWQRPWKPSYPMMDLVFHKDPVSSSEPSDVQTVGFLEEGPQTAS